MINIEILGKFFDNHSLSIINRQIALNLNKVEDFNIFLTPLDELTNDFKVNKNNIKTIKTLSEKECDYVHIQIRHSYPPIWNWPTNKETKVIYIQPWEFPKVPFEWQYRFETFADTLCVPSNYEKDIALSVSLKLGNYISNRFPEVEVIYTRKEDIFLELNERYNDHL